MARAKADEFVDKFWSGANLFELHKACCGRDDNPGWARLYVWIYGVSAFAQKGCGCRPFKRSETTRGKYFIAQVPFASTEDLESFKSAALTT